MSCHFKKVDHPCHDVTRWIIFSETHARVETENWNDADAENNTDTKSDTDVDTDADTKSDLTFALFQRILAKIVSCFSDRISGSDRIVIFWLLKLKFRSERKRFCSFLKVCSSKDRKRSRWRHTTGKIKKEGGCKFSFLNFCGFAGNQQFVETVAKLFFFWGSFLWFLLSG